MNEDAKNGDYDELQNEYDDFVGKDMKKNVDAEASDLLKKYSKESKEKYGKKYKHTNKALVLPPVKSTLMPGMLQIQTNSFNLSANHNSSAQSTKSELPILAKSRC